MGKNRKYSGFTLVEMLIVMGIIIILMVIGITAGRFAINRANDITHRNAVEELYTSLQAFYTDERRYPTGTSNSGLQPLCTEAYCTVESLVSNGGPTTDGWLVPYIDRDSFEGGSTATYFYGVGGDGGDQAVLGCVTLRGPVGENAEHPDGAVYCAGNGIGVDTIIFEGTTITIPTAEMTQTEHGTLLEWTTIHGLTGATWNGDDWGI